MAAVQPTGMFAEKPWLIPAKGWKQIARRTWDEAGNDNIGLVAAGVAFYGFLAMVPMLGALVLSYGLIASPEAVVRDLQGLAAILPADAARLVGDQLLNVVSTSDGKKGAGLFLAICLALFGARNGAGGLITALNIAYEEDEKRSFFEVTLLTLVITGAAVIVLIVALTAIAAIGDFDKLLETSQLLTAIGRVLAYMLLLVVGAAGAAALYRFAPSRARAAWIWLTPGSVLAAVLWLVVTLGFGIYVANFGKYNATYGSLGAVVVLLTWLYLSSYILLFGAELNAEIEHQTAMDSTSGAEKPLGARGAWVADHVASNGPAPVAQAPAFEAENRHNTIVIDEPMPGPSRRIVIPTVTAATANRLFGNGTSAFLTTGLAAVGLAKIRTRGQSALGAVLLLTAGGLAFLGRAGPAKHSM